MISYIHDIDIYGREETSGKPFEILNEEAINNALTLWLTSKAGDFLRNPTVGGILDRILFKNIESESLDKWLFSLKNAVFFEFIPSIDIIDLSIENEYSQRYLKIKLVYRINLTNQIQSLEVFTKNLLPIVEQKQQSIPYTGQNLLMFCMIRKPDMKNKLLEYDIKESKWEWGIYEFINFSDSDTYYEQILSICNE